MTTIAELREQVRGPVIEPGDDGYDEHRRVYNGMHDRRPLAVVRAAATRRRRRRGRASRRENGLDLAVRCGGHSVPGFGTSDGGVVIDLSPMRNVHVDPRRANGPRGWRRHLGDFDHATHAFGLATTGGIISTTGVGGLTLGGGIGYLARGCGLSCDNLLSRRCRDRRRPDAHRERDENEDLFWALRGGGGNFGVVTSLEFQLCIRSVRSSAARCSSRSRMPAT